MFFKCTVMLVLVAATTITSAWHHGNATNRWTNNKIVKIHADAVSSVPLRIAEWRVVDEGAPLADYVEKELGVHGHFNRIYENDTGNRVTALLMVGDAGPLVRHPVEICYGNRAKKLVNSFGLRFKRNGNPQQFKIHRYEPKSALDDEFYVAYSFCYDDAWDTPAVPRYEYGGKPVLYKLQVLTNAGETASHESPAYLRDFIEKFSANVWHGS